MTDEVAEIVDLDTVDKFAKFIFAWHANRVARLEHLLQVPQGIEFKVGDGPEQKLEGDLYSGFIMGINMALNEVGNLPVTITPAEPEAANDAKSKH